MDTQWSSKIYASSGRAEIELGILLYKIAIPPQSLSPLESLTHLSVWSVVDWCVVGAAAAARMLGSNMMDRKLSQGVWAVYKIFAVVCRCTLDEYVSVIYMDR